MLLYGIKTGKNVSVAYYLTGSIKIECLLRQDTLRDDGIIVLVPVL